MRKISLFALSLLASAGLFAQTQVTADKTGTELQAAIDAAEAGTTIYVQAGTYEGNFKMKEGVNVSGGWNEDFTAQTDYASVLDAKENGRVLEQPANFTTLTVWSNFTIQNGKLAAASTVPANNLGAGVALGKKGQVKHCLIQNNTFSYNGNCMGGGVGNDAIDAATDVCAEDCIIRNNCGTHGGGVRVRGTVLNCIIENNNTNNDVKKGPAGGVHLQAGRMVGCVVRGNKSGGDTGGVRAYGKCQIINCLIVGNIATGKVGGIGIENANSDVIGCTIVDNDQLSSNAGDNTKCGISCGATSDNGTKLANNIVWGNKHNGIAQTAQIYYISHYAAENRIYNAVAHQNTTNGIKLSMDNDADDTYADGDGNEQTGRAPHFADPANGDYRLTWLSPMLNKGNDELTTVAADLDGNDRKVLKVDMGAYELPYYTLTIAEFEHATLTVGETPMAAGAYELPQGYSTAATIVAEEGWTIKKVTIGDAILEPQEGVYTLPALTADVTLTITVEQIMVNLTIAAFEHATLTVTGQGVLPAGTYPVPYGYTTTATLAADEGWNIKSVKLGAEELVAVEGVYTLPAIKADATLTIEVEQIMVNLTVAAFEHATLTVEGVGVTVAGTYPVPYGYTTTATLVADEGYTIKSVKLGEDELVPVEGVYTIPALKADVTITITVEKNEVTAIINGQQQAVSRKVLRDGQLLIIRNEATFNAQGQVVK